MKRTLRVYAIADVHSPDSFSMPELMPDQFDVVLTLGDIDDATIDYIAFMSRRIPRYGVPGGHDPQYTPGMNSLHLKVVAVKGITIGGFGGSPKYKDHPNHFTGNDVAKAMKGMPPVDVFISHTPPLATSANKDLVHRGFPAFDHYIKRYSPSYWLHGHLERYYKAQVDQTTVYGVSLRQPLSLHFDKSIYPPDDLEPQRGTSMKWITWMRRFMSRRKKGEDEALTMRG
jgi:hypothetical protein